ncbi:MAG TPA: hypothetical protein VGS41_14965 [Chthonomonadales bacterium]|nr:hypothetical protein [Chthonomonadales bacterium]
MRTSQSPEWSPAGIAPMPEPSLRLLRVLQDETQPPLILMDDGQDFESLYCEWCQQDDAYCEDQLEDGQWQDIVTFLKSRGVRIVDPVAFQDLGDFYGML